MCFGLITRCIRIRHPAHFSKGRILNHFLKVYRNQSAERYFAGGCGAMPALSSSGQLSIMPFSEFWRETARYPAVHSFPAWGKWVSYLTQAGNYHRAKQHLGAEQLCHTNFIPLLHLHPVVPLLYHKCPIRGKYRAQRAGVSMGADPILAAPPTRFTVFRTL